MDLKSPFDNQSGLQAHQDFSQAAHGTVARKISMGVSEPLKTEAPERGDSAADADPKRKPLTLSRSAEQKSYPRDRTRLRCPHCKEPCKSRTSFETSALTRTFVYECTNYECGHRFVAVMEIHYTTTLSSTPDPSVNLRVSKHIRRDLIRAQLDHALPAEHQTKHTKPVTGDLFSGLPPEPQRN